MATEKCPLDYWPRWNNESAEEYDKKVQKAEMK